MKTGRLYAVALLMLLPCSAWSDITASRYIFEFNLDGTDGAHYFKAAGTPSASSNIGWGAQLCPNAEYAYTQGNLLGRKEILAVALSASALGRPVIFEGDCAPNGGGNYFIIYRIRMGQ